jgi:formamidopyrimidine-DNA glycosylase
MPELPEVETVVRDLRAHGLPGSVIRSVTVRWPRTVAEQSPGVFCRALAGRAITAVTRRAKFIVLDLDSGSRLLLHLRMTGKLRFAAAGERPGPHDHVSLCLADGRELIFNDTRKFGRFRLVQPGDDPLAVLGPEPLEVDFTLALFKLRLKGKARQIKPLLLDQTTVAGLGNIYADEALWQARLHRSAAPTPQRRRNPSPARGDTRGLAAAVDNAGTTLGEGETNFYSVSGHRGRNADALKVFRRDGLPARAAAP